MVVLVTTDEPVGEPDVVVPGMAVDVAAGAALTPGGGASASVVTTLDPPAGSDGAGVRGGMVSPTLPFEPLEVRLRDRRAGQSQLLADLDAIRRAIPFIWAIAATVVLCLRAMR